MLLAAGDLFGRRGFFDGVPTFFVIFALFVMTCLVAGFGFVFYQIFRSVQQAAYNRSQPVISRQARVIGRRQHVWGESSSTTYYLTFEFPDGSREEFRVPDQTFGLLVEGDQGTLRTQGTDFKGFDRMTA